MTSLTGHGETRLHLNNDQINHVIELLLPQFEKKMKFYFYFNCLFLMFGVAEIFLLVTFFAFLAHSFVLALSLAFVFLTFFSYFTLRVYLQTKRPEQIQDIALKFVQACKNIMNYQEGNPQQHVGLAKACCRFADSLNCREYHFYTLPSRLDQFSKYLEKLSCWWHWQDVFRLKELLLRGAVEENVKLVKCEPTSLEAHASLANAYVMLSGLFVDPRKLDDYDEERWLPADRFTPDMQSSFCEISKRAIEEFKILQDYAPNDPWVHAQLAYSYRDLKMPKEEIQEYEKILKLNPEDRDTLFRLGILYFEQGFNSQGLKIYEDLKKIQPKKAENLIRHYGSNINI